MTLQLSMSPLSFLSATQDEKTSEDDTQRDEKDAGSYQKKFGSDLPSSQRLGFGARSHEDMG